MSKIRKGFTLVDVFGRYGSSPELSFVSLSLSLRRHGVGLLLGAVES